MDSRLRLVTVLGAVILAGVVLELVRRRRLSEEYSVLWVVTAALLLVLAIWSSLLDSITSLIGAASSTSTVFFFGLLFALILLLQFSVRISTLEKRLKELVQQVAVASVEPRGDSRDGPKTEVRGIDHESDAEEVAR